MLNREDILTNQANLWVLSTLIVSSIPSLLHLPIWVVLVVLLSIFWRYYGAEYLYKTQGKIVTSLILISGIAGIFVSFPSWFSGDSLLSFFVIVVFLKWSELKTRRDGLLLIFVAVILSAIGGMYWQTILSLMHMLLVAFMLLLALMSINDMGNAIYWQQLIAKGASLFLLSLPLVVIMFSLLPRIPGPIWDIGIAFGMPINLSLDEDRKTPSITKQMTPGTISRVKKSDSPIMVVEFGDNQVPYKSKMYWRGPVFYDFDGRNWLLNQNSDLPKTIKKPFRGRSGKQKYDKHIFNKSRPLNYKARVSSHNDYYLYALELVYGSFPETLITEDYQLVSVRPLTSGEFSYEMTGYLTHEIGKNITKNKLERALAIDKNKYPKLHEFATSFSKNESQDIENIIANILNHYRVEKFELNEDTNYVENNKTASLDEFFFENKSGDLLDFASSFAILMRTIGIPSRLISGYRGADLIALTDFVIVRDNHAHVWVEVYSENKGWIRVDLKDIIVPPKLEVEKNASGQKDTSFTKPQKIKTQNITNDSSVKNNIESIVKIKTNEKKDNGNSILPDFFNWKKWSSGLEKWVINYNPNRQVELFSGKENKNIDWASLTAYAIIAIILFLLLYVLILRWSNKRNIDQVTLEWNKFLQILEKLGIKRHPTQCSSVLQQKIEQQKFDFSSATKVIIDLYIKIRYQKHNQQDIKKFVILIKRFKAMV